MNETVKANILSTLERLNTVINSHPLIERLSPLVEISLAIVGGAVRDMYLDKPIKDVDIGVFLNFHKNLKVEYPQSRYHRDCDDIIVEQASEALALECRSRDIINLLNQSEFEMVHPFLKEKDRNPNEIKVIAQLIKKILEQDNEYSITEPYGDNNNNGTQTLCKDKAVRESAYSSIGLSAVMAVRARSSEYPIELLFSTDRVDNFLYSFDFDICKIYMKSVEKNAVIVPTKMFLKDVENKTITYTPRHDLTEEKMNKSLLIRYERLRHKYPNYTLIEDTSELVAAHPLKEKIQITIEMSRLANELRWSAKESESFKAGLHKIKI